MIFNKYFFFLIYIILLYYIIKQYPNTHEKFNIYNHHKSTNTNKHNICTGNLSDLEYLEHMIPHHKVAVDISKLLQKKTKWPIMLEMLRKIIWTQNYEIVLMNELYTKMPKNDISSQDRMNKKYISIVSDFIEPNKIGLTHTYCDPHFFDPKKHMEHLQTMNIDDNMYIKHMIPHHQVAVDMSKKLLQNSDNDFMIYLAYRIIRSQQREIIYLGDMLKSLESKYDSYLNSNLV